MRKKECSSCNAAQITWRGEEPKGRTDVVYTPEVDSARCGSGNVVLGPVREEDGGPAARSAVRWAAAGYGCVIDLFLHRSQITVSPLKQNIILANWAGWA